MWTSLKTIKDEFRRFSVLAWSIKEQEKLDILKPRSITFWTVWTAQYYVDGAGVPDNEISICELCLDWSAKYQSVFRIITFAKIFVT